MKNIFSDFNEIYEAQAKKIFSLQNGKEIVENDKLNYEKYYQKCVENLAQIDVKEIMGDVASLENEIKEKVAEMEKLEENSKKMMINDKKGILINTNNLNLDLLASASALDFPDDYSTLNKVIKNIKDKVGNISARLNNLESQSIESIKKMKNLYETQDEVLLSKLHKLANEKLQSSIKILLESVKEKVKVYEDKAQTKQANTTKVEKFNSDLEKVKEKHQEANLQNQMTLEEIDSYKSNIALVEKEYNRTKTSIRQIKTSTAWNTNTPTGKPSSGKLPIYSLKLSEERERQTCLELLTENKIHSQEIENNMMLEADLVSLKGKVEQIETTSLQNKINILSLIGIMMNCLLLKKKLSPANIEKDSMNSGLSSLKSAMEKFEQLKAKESKLKQVNESYLALREKIAKCQEKERKRAIICEKLQIK